jgi:hypothetical protein
MASKNPPAGPLAAAAGKGFVRRPEGGQVSGNLDIFEEFPGIFRRWPSMQNLAIFEASGQNSWRPPIYYRLLPHGHHSSENTHPSPPSWPQDASEQARTSQKLSTMPEGRVGPG